MSGVASVVLSCIYIIPPEFVLEEVANSFYLRKLRQNLFSKMTILHGCQSRNLYALELKS